MDCGALLKLWARGAAGLGATKVLGPLAGSPAGAAPAPAGDRPAALRTRLTDRYGVAFPIVQAGMAFYATPALAAAVTNAGGLRVLGPVPEGPAGPRRPIRHAR